MKALSLLFASATMLATAGADALAQDRGARDGRARDNNVQSRDYRGDGTRDGGQRWDGRGHDGYRGGGGYGWSAPRYFPRYSYPYSYSVWPPLYGYYSYPYPYAFYSPAPRVYVERIYEPEYSPPPAPRQYSYEERSHAQVTPPAKPAPAPQPPRLERFTLSAKELFDFDQAKLRMPQPRLDEIADLMKRNPAINNVHITGYTDRIGSDEYNMKLSKRRAEAVRNYLVAKGVQAHRLVAVGKGEADPVVQCNDKNQAALIKCLEPNRRVEVEQITVERRVQ